MIDPDLLRIKLWDLGEVLSAAWKVFRACFRQIALAVLVVMVPWHLITAWLDAALASMDKDVANPGLNALSFSLAYFGFLFQIWVTMAVTVISERALAGETYTFRRALEAAYRRWSSGITTGILGYLILIGLTFLLIIPGVIWAVYYAFMLQAVMLRDKKNKDALDYSRFLIIGQWWNAFFIVFGLAVLMAMAGYAITLFLGLVPSAYMSSFLTSCTLEVVYSFNTVAITLFFLNSESYRKVEPEPEIVEPIS